MYAKMLFILQVSILSEQMNHIEVMPVEGTLVERGLMDLEKVQKMRAIVRTELA